MTEFRYASVSLITNSSKDAILKVLSNDKVNLKLPLISVSESLYPNVPVPSSLLTTITYDDLQLLIYEVSFTEKKKIILQAALGKTTDEKVEDAILKLSELGKLLNIDYLIEVMLIYVLDVELRGLSKYKKAGYVLLDYSVEGDLRESEYLSSINVLPYVLDSRKSLVEIIYRNRQVSVDVIKSLINEIEKIVRGDEKLA
ncbi:conserved hypothetical protein [Sulfolobus islandicus Y.G.57.14]|uniref:Uncharacterized protein n=1 Tax=Saccharolobus islandicus (strain Y.G.57.14 / Yellowstone \|nr:hypothetical protein [Sulfolobus islandicus]ACP44937.1 conserved hypothetical protein [Sulfolobus islandicus Y.G.57.14]